MSWKGSYRRSYMDDNFEWVEPLNRAMECLIDVLSYVERLDQENSVFTAFDRVKYNKSVNAAVKSYLAEANKLIVTLLTFHPGASCCPVTRTGWRDESEYKKMSGQADRLRKSDSDIPGLDYTISALRDIGSLLSIYAKLLRHRK